jgi:uncharacterized protein
LLLDLSSALKNPGEEMPFTHLECIPPQEILGETVTYPDPIELTGIMQASEGKIRLTGMMKATANAHCANCLSPVCYRQMLVFDEVLIKTSDAEQLPDQVDRDDRFEYAGSTADLEHLTLTYLLLDLPIRFLCRKDCRGLLDIQTGNEDSQVDPDHPFAVLSQLLIKKEKE